MDNYMYKKLGFSDEMVRAITQVETYNIQSDISVPEILDLEEDCFEALSNYVYSN